MWDFYYLQENYFEIPYDTYYCTDQVFHSLKATNDPDFDVDRLLNFAWVATPTETQPQQMTMKWVFDPNYPDKLWD